MTFAGVDPLRRIASNARARLATVSADPHDDEQMWQRNGLAWLLVGERGSHAESARDVVAAAP